MTRRVRLSEEARIFLRREVGYLGERSPAAARRLLDRMREAGRNLAAHPSMGPATADDIVPGTRRLVAGKYVLTYLVSVDTVDIVSIRHGRMQRPPIEIEDE